MSATVECRWRKEQTGSKIYIHFFFGINKNKKLENKYFKNIHKKKLFASESQFDS